MQVDVIEELIFREREKKEDNKKEREKKEDNKKEREK
jgi:hypothetical protein